MRALLTRSLLALLAVPLALACSSCGAGKGAAGAAASTDAGGGATGSGAASSAGAPSGGARGAQPPCAPASATFCWVQPLPQGGALQAAALLVDATGLVAGPSATLRLQGGTLAPATLGGGAAIRALWSPDGVEVWAAGDGVQRLAGGAWAAVPGAPPGPWRALGGSGPADVWVVGDAGAAAHWDGAAWTLRPTGLAGPLSAVGAAGPGQAWATAADGGTVLRFDGAGWSVAAQLPSAALAAVLVRGAADVWVAGEARAVNPAAGATGAALAHFDGVSWSAVALPGQPGARLGALAADAGVVWAAGEDGSGRGLVARLEGGAWSPEALPGAALPVRALDARSGRVLAAGDGGQVLLREGGRWSAVAQGIPGYLQSAAITADGAVWFSAAAPDASGARLLRIADGQVEAVPVGLDDVLYGLAADGDGLWVGSLAHGLVRYAGGRFTPGAAGTSGLADGPYVTGPGTVWAAAGSAAFRVDGSSASTVSLPSPGARRLFGAGGELWAVSGGPAALRWDGARWTAVALPGMALAGWSAGPGDAWLVGEGGLALRWDGRAFARVDAGTSATLRAIHGRVGADGAPEVWAVGDAGAVVRWNGSGFSPVDAGTTAALAAVAVAPDGTVWVGGENGAVLRKAP